MGKGRTRGASVCPAQAAQQCPSCRPRLPSVAWRGSEGHLWGRGAGPWGLKSAWGVLSRKGRRSLSGPWGLLHAGHGS